MIHKVLTRLHIPHRCIVLARGRMLVNCTLGPGSGFHITCNEDTVRLAGSVVSDLSLPEEANSLQQVTWVLNGDVIGLDYSDGDAVCFFMEHQFTGNEAVDSDSFYELTVQFLARYIALWNHYH